MIKLMMQTQVHTYVSSVFIQIDLIYYWEAYNIPKQRIYQTLKQTHQGRRFQITEEL